MIDGTAAAPLPIALGHEGAGVVHAVGEREGRERDARPPDQVPEADRDYFLERRYPSFGNLVPRDVASRNAKEVCDAGRGVGPSKQGVYLDFAESIGRLGQEVIDERYGNLFEMYERIVREAVEELKEEEFRGTFHAQKSETPGSQLTPVETIIESDTEALIPDVYIESDTERLDVYRRLYRAAARGDLRVMRDELQDRFGEYPQEVEHLFRLVELRLIAARGGFPKVSLKEQLLTITLPASSNKEFYGDEDSADAPFQRIARRLADGTVKNIRLHQQDNELMLLIPLTGLNSSQDRLAEAQKKINELSEILAYHAQ